MPANRKKRAFFRRRGRGQHQPLKIWRDVDQTKKMLAREGNAASRFLRTLATPIMRRAARGA
jgi:hypothetical protein